MGKVGCFLLRKPLGRGGHLQGCIGWLVPGR
jgi:hypothetical protein